MSSSNCWFLTCIQVSQEAGQVVWYSHLLNNFPLFIVIHTFKSFGIVNKAEIDVFLELSCFFDDPADVDNLISGSSAFSKSSLNIWKFMVHVLLKPGLENFEHYFTRVWDECNCVVVWALFAILFLRDLNEHWPFQSCGHCWVFQICYHIECSTFTVSSLRIWNSSTGIPPPPLALFVVMLPKAHSTSPCYSLELYIQMGMSFLFSFAFHFSSFQQLFVRPPQTPILPFWISFSWGWSCFLSPVRCQEAPSIVHQALSIKSSCLNLFLVA